MMVKNEEPWTSLFDGDEQQKLQVKVISYCVYKTAKS